MKKIDEELVMLQKRIEIKQRIISNLIGIEQTQESIAYLKLEIETLKRKVIILEEMKKTGSYTPKEPKLGDERYAGFFHKEALDMLRVLYFDIFHKDPSINSVRAMTAMFGDDTLPIYGTLYLIRGQVPFELVLQDHYKDYKPNENCSVGISFDQKNIKNGSDEEYVKLMSACIKKYSNNEVNIICGTGASSKCTMAYIDDSFFRHYTYYDFFDFLFDNNFRNVIYVGDTMKRNAKPGEIESVYSNFIVPDIEHIAQGLNMPIADLIKSNEKIRKLILTPQIRP